MGQKNPQADCLCLWYKFLAFFYRGRKQSNLSSFQIDCKGTTKNAHTQAKQTLFSKKIDFSIV